MASHSPNRPAPVSHKSFTEAPAIGRVVSIVQGQDTATIGLYREEQFFLLASDPLKIDGVSIGDIVGFTLSAPDRIGTLGRIGGAAPRAWRDGGDALRWRKEYGGSTRMERLRLRHRIVRELRAYFDEEGFIEVETPILVPAPSPEAQFSPFTAGDRFLITSPEFQLKRMLVGGFERIYRIGPVFRGREAGRLHNPEFTLLEWYRAGCGLGALAQDLEAILQRLLPLATVQDEKGRLGVTADPYADPDAEPARVDIAAPFHRHSVAQLFREHLGMNIAGATRAAELRRAAIDAGVADTEGLPEDFEGAFFLLWSRFEHELGRDRPLLVVDWPAPLASLARLKPGDPTVAERMELLLGGIELANGFAELTDAAEQRRRFEKDLANRAARALPAVPLDERFLDSLAQGLPPAAGMALGVDRLVMVLTGATHIAQVLPFAWDEL